MTDQTEHTEDEPMRAFTKALFAPDEPDEPEPDEQQKPGNFSPGEGNNPTGEAHDIRTLAERLFFNPND